MLVKKKVFLPKEILSKRLIFTIEHPMPPGNRNSREGAGKENPGTKKTFVKLQAAA